MVAFIFVTAKCIFFIIAVHALAKTIQGTIVSDSGSDFDQSWICVM